MFSNLGTPDEEAAKVKRISYFENVSKVFSLDINSEEKSLNRKQKFLRPEFLQNYKVKLNPDSCSNKTRSKASDQLQSAVFGASNYLKKHVIAKLIDKLETLEYLPIDTVSMTSIFHNLGVNMRYLGYVASKAKLPHVRDHCVVEMVARSMAKLYHYETSATILEAGITSMLNSKSAQDIDGPVKKRLEGEFEDMLRNVAADFLNILVGDSEISNYFWSSKLRW